MSRFYEPDLGANPDDPFARDTEGKLVRRGFWLDMSDRSLVLAMTQGIGANRRQPAQRSQARAPGRHRPRTPDRPGLPPGNPAAGVRNSVTDSSIGVASGEVRFGQPQTCTGTI
jgi:hypothetical protein